MNQLNDLFSFIGFLNTSIYDLFRLKMPISYNRQWIYLKQRPIKWSNFDFIIIFNIFPIKIAYFLLNARIFQWKYERDKSIQRFSNGFAVMVLHINMPNSQVRATFRSWILCFLCWLLTQKKNQYSLCSIDIHLRSQITYHFRP